MTEDQWRSCSDPSSMLKSVGGRASERKLRLFACACCRRIWHLLADERSRAGVEVAEQYADGFVREEQLNSISASVAALGVGFGVQFSTVNAVHFAARPGRVFADRCAMYAARAVAETGEPAEQAALLRCILGPLSLHPIRLFPAPPASPLTKLAQAIYEERRFGDIPILGDALEEAGCDNDEVLTHCRSEGPHARGCWVVDLVLGKS